MTQTLENIAQEPLTPLGKLQDSFQKRVVVNLPTCDRRGWGSTPKASFPLDASVR